VTVSRIQIISEDFAARDIAGIKFRGQIETFEDYLYNNKNLSRKPPTPRLTFCGWGSSLHDAVRAKTSMGSAGVMFANQEPAILLQGQRSRCPAEVKYSGYPLPSNEICHQTTVDVKMFASLNFREIVEGMRTLLLARIVRYIYARLSVEEVPRGFAPP
jgi:hypothetical protein